MALPPSYTGGAFARSMPLPQADNSGARAIAGAVEQLGAVGAQARQQDLQVDARIEQIQRDRVRQDQAADFGLRFAQKRAELSQRITDLRAAPAPGAKGHADQVNALWDQASKDLIDPMTDPEARQSALTMLADYGGRLKTDEYAFETGKRIEKLGTDATQTFEQQALIARGATDGKTFVDEIARVDQFVPTLGLGEDATHKLTRMGKAQITRAFLEGTMERDPAAARELIDKPAIAALLADPDLVTGLSRSIGVEERRVEAAKRAEAAAALAAQKDQLATQRAMLDTGAGRPEDWDALAAGYAAAGEEAQAVGARAKGGEMRATVQYRAATLSEMDQRLSVLQGKRNNGGLSTAEASEMAGLSDLRRQSAERLNDTGGALSQYLFATGKTLPPISPEDAGGMRQRAQLATAAAAQYGRAIVQPIMEAELPVFRDMFAQGPAGKLRALQAIRQFGDARSVAGAAIQIAGNDDGDFRIAATLPPSIARDVLLGPDKLKTQPGVLNAKEAARVLSTYYGSALRQVGGGYDTDVLKAASQFYASRMVDGGETRWDAGRFAEALETVIGRNRASDGTIRGGVARSGQGLVILPPDRTPEALLRTFARAGEPDYRAAAGGRAPRWGDGSPMTLGHVRSLLPTYRGNGRYGFRGRDGRLIPNDQGGVYEVDIYQLKAR